MLTRKVNLKADVGKVYPPVTFVWFTDDQEIENAKGKDSVSIDVNALDNDKYVSGKILINLKIIIPRARSSSRNLHFLAIDLKSS